MKVLTPAGLLTPLRPATRTVAVAGSKLAHRLSTSVAGVSSSYRSPRFKVSRSSRAPVVGDVGAVLGAANPDIGASR